MFWPTHGHGVNLWSFCCSKGGKRSQGKRWQISVACVWCGVVWFGCSARPHYCCRQLVYNDTALRSFQGKTKIDLKRSSRYRLLVVMMLLLLLLLLFAPPCRGRDRHFFSFLFCPPRDHAAVVRYDTPPSLKKTLDPLPSLLFSPPA